MNLSNGKIWPYAIGISIVFIFSACVATIVVSSKLPVEKSDLFMTHYHDADKRANDIIEARIAFDKRYKIDYVTDGISVENTTIKYKITEINSKAVDNAKVIIVITRPNSRKLDQEFSTPSVENGIYTFSNIKLPKEGRWDIMAKVSVDDLQRYYNVKADTREAKFTEY